MHCLTLILLHPSSFLKNLDVNSIWYHSEALEVLYSSNQFLGLDFFLLFLALVSYSCSFRTNLVHSEPSDFHYSLNQFLGGGFLWRFLQQEGSRSVSCFCVREAMFFCLIKDRILSVFTLLPVGLHYHKLHGQRQISDIYLIDIQLTHHLYQFTYTECTLVI